MRKLPDDVLEMIIPLAEYVSDDPDYIRTPGTSDWFYTCKNTRARFINYGAGPHTGYTDYAGTWLFEVHEDQQAVHDWLLEHEEYSSYLED